MEIVDLWDSLSVGVKIIVQLAAAITAVVLIWKTGRRIVKWFLNSAAQVNWLLGEQHDHQVIKDTLDEIKGELTSNGGSSLKDHVHNIKLSQEYIQSHIKTSHNVNPKALFETDATGKVIHTNRAFSRMTGFSSHEVKGLGWINLIDPLQRDAVVTKWLRTVDDKRDFDEHLNYVRPDGTTYLVHALAYAIRSSDGDLLGHFGEIIPIEEE
jgi:PAS domain S-box-containing protein